MSVVVDSKRTLHLVLGLLATVAMCWSASAAEQTYKPFKWHTPTDSDLILLPLHARGGAEFELKWSFITWVNSVANARPQEAASFISSGLSVDRVTAAQLIGFGAEATARLNQSMNDRSRLCDSLRAAKTEQAFASALDTHSLQSDQKRAELVGDLDSLFAGPTADKIHTWIQKNVQSTEEQGNSDWHGVLATTEARQGVIDRACGAAGK